MGYPKPQQQGAPAPSIASMGGWLGTILPRAVRQGLGERNEILLSPSRVDLG